MPKTQKTKINDCNECDFVEYPDGHLYKGIVFYDAKRPERAMCGLVKRFILGRTKTIAKDKHWIVHGNYDNLPKYIPKWCPLDVWISSSSYLKSGWKEP